MTYAACILWTILVAIASAANDAERIALNEKIHHVRAWFIRAAFVAIVCIAAGHPWLTVGMGALFSMVFRFTLNDVRELDWRYVSPSSWYDWQFIRHTLGWVNRLRYRERVIGSHGINYFEPIATPEYPVRIHRAGLLAYIAEAVVIALYILL